MRTWHILLVGAVVLIGCGIFFALQDFGTSTNWASIGSFFLALVVGIGSVLSLVSSKAKKGASSHGSNDQPHGRGIIVNLRNKMVVNGDHSHVEATFGEPSSWSSGHRKPKPTSQE
jgi:hypothetical protein